MYPISESAKARFLSGQKQIARLTVNNNPYEPYKENSYYCNFTVEGENIFTRVGETENKYLNSSGAEANSNYYCITDYLEVEPLKRYVFDKIDYSVISRSVYHAYFDENKTLIRVSPACQEFHIPPTGTKYVRLSFRKTYAPDSVHIELGTVYKGTLNVKTGVLTVTHGFVNDLSHYTYALASNTYPYIFTADYMSNGRNSQTQSDRNKGFVCSGYKASANTSVNANFNPYSCLFVGTSVALAGNGRFYFRNDDYTGDATTFRASMAGIQAVYPFDEPCTYQLTAQEVRTLLGYNNIWSDTGSVNLSYRNTSGEVVAKSGDMVSIDDGAKNIPLASLSLPLLPKQDLHGYDYPWVGGGGKNKVNINGESIGDTWFTPTDNVTTLEVGKIIGAIARNGYIRPSYIDYTISGNTITYSGNHATNYGVGLTFKASSGVTYTGSTTEAGTKAFIFYDANKKIIEQGSQSSSAVTSFSATAPQGATYGVFALMEISLSVTYTATNIQVEAGSPATTYEPYENICPIEGCTSATIHQTGKNMFNGYYINGDYDNNGQFRLRDGQYIAVIFDDIYQDTNFIVEGGKDYTICFDTIGIRGKDFYTLEFDKETGEYIRGTKTLRFTQQAGKTIPRYITVRPYFDSILVWYWDAGYGYDDEYDSDEFEEITMVTLPSQIVEDVVIRETDIVEGSLSVNRYCTTGKSAMIGSCVASEMNVILNNENGNYNDVNFIGKDISVEVGTLDANDNPDFMPVGIFQVDDSPKKLEHISITALDRMMLLEKPLENLPYPTIVRYLYEDICSRTNVRRKTTELWNENYVIDTPPENLQTYRDVLSCICEITGTCAYFDWDGRLCLEWFSSEEPTIELTTANRIVSDLAEESVQITGVEVKAGEETYLAGTDAYTLSVAQNPLVTHDAQALADALYEHLGWLAYRPFTATVLPMPYIYPMDMATFVDKDGNESLVAITDWTFRLNRNTELRGRGESSQQASFKKKYGIGENGADIDEALGILRDTIIKNAEIINQQMETIERTLHGQYEALSSEFGSYRNETDAKITANAEGITQAYTNIEEIDSKYGVAITDTNQAIVQVADGAVATNTKFREVTEAYIKSGKLYYEGTTPVYGVAVGQLTYEMIGGEQLIKRSGVYSVFTSDELAFYIDDVKVAYMKNKKLYINEAEFVSAINVGRYKLEDGANGFTIKYGG